MNIDLWVDGSIYLNDPATNLCPDFKSVTHLLRYVCEGNSGLLGYCQRLCDIGMHSISCLNQQLQFASQQLQCANQQLLHYVQRTSAENNALKNVMSELNVTVTTLQGSNQEMLESMEKLRSESLKSDDDIKIINKAMMRRKRKRVPMKNIDDLSTHSSNQKKKKRIRAFKYVVI
ncbi:hypothetical protein O6H91_Y204500 [Diphasiastrum complanatum]|nr:hypothetical protein O6H91_Y204500 [Diphasiastrum complanatum]